MKPCPHCTNLTSGSKEQTEKPRSLLRWLGVYSHCDTCDSWHFRMWDNRSLAGIVLSVILFQVLASIVVFPALYYLIGSEALRIILFTFFHLACLPLYFMMSVTVMVNGH